MRVGLLKRGTCPNPLPRRSWQPGLLRCPDRGELRAHYGLDDLCQLHPVDLPQALQLFLDSICALEGVLKAQAPGRQGVNEDPPHERPPRLAIHDPNALSHAIPLGGIWFRALHLSTIGLTVRASHPVPSGSVALETSLAPGGHRRIETLGLNFSTQANKKKPFWLDFTPQSAFLSIGFHGGNGMGVVRSARHRWIRSHHSGLNVRTCRNANERLAVSSDSARGALATVNRRGWRTAAHLLRPHPAPQTGDRNPRAQCFLLEIRKSTMAIQKSGSAAMQRIHPEN